MSMALPMLRESCLVACGKTDTCLMRTGNKMGTAGTPLGTALKVQKPCLVRKFSQDLCLILVASGEVPKPSVCMFMSPVHKKKGTQVGMANCERCSMSSVRLSSSRAHSASLSGPSGGNERVAQWKIWPPSNKMLSTFCDHLPCPTPARAS